MVKLFAFVLFVFTVGFVVWLEIFLSKMKNKWLGLILPALGFLYSLLMVGSLTVFKRMEIGQIIMSALFTFFVSNIPTVILLAIYFGVREKRKLRSEIDKMNIQDL